MPNYLHTGVYYCRKRILKFNACHNCVSQEDIMSLFIGLCRLIKTSSELEIKNKYISRIKYLEKVLDKNKINYIPSNLFKVL